MLLNSSLQESEPLAGLNHPISISLKTVKVSYTVKSLHGSKTVTSSMTTVIRTTTRKSAVESEALAHVG